MNVQKLSETFTSFDIRKQGFLDKKLFICTCIVLGWDIHLKKMDQKFSFGVLIGYAISCMG